MCITVLIAHSRQSTTKPGKPCACRALCRLGPVWARSSPVSLGNRRGCPQAVHSMSTACPPIFGPFPQLVHKSPSRTALSRPGGDRVQPPAGIAFSKPSPVPEPHADSIHACPGAIYPQAAHSIFTACTPLSGAFPQLFNRVEEAPRLALG